jgi:hypothetical protein
LKKVRAFLLVAFCLWFGWDGFITTDPEMLEHQGFNRVMFGLTALLCLWVVPRGIKTKHDDQAAPAADKARNLLADYGQVLEKFAGFEVVDVRELPGTKEEVKRAIKMAWTISDAQMKNMLGGAFVMLSMFQEGVGEPIASIGSTMKSMASAAGDVPPLPPENDPEARAAWSKANSASIRAMAASIASQGDKVGGWPEIVTAEMMRLTNEFAVFKAEYANK